MIEKYLTVLLFHSLAVRITKRTLIATLVMPRNKHHVVAASELRSWARRQYKAYSRPKTVRD
jgi:hypothetical protein